MSDHPLDLFGASLRGLCRFVSSFGGLDDYEAKRFAEASKHLENAALLIERIVVRRRDINAEPASVWGPAVDIARSLHTSPERALEYCTSPTLRKQLWTELVFDARKDLEALGKITVPHGPGVTAATVLEGVTRVSIEVLQHRGLVELARVNDDNHQYGPCITAAGRVLLEAKVRGEFR